jgi:hypothetical protein
MRKSRLPIYVVAALSMLGLSVMVMQPTAATLLGDSSTPSSSTSSTSSSTSSTSSSTTSSSTTTTKPPRHEGCTPGFWKNHLDAWVPTGFSPDQTLGSVFDAAGLGSLADDTLLTALSYPGGPDLVAAKRILLRHAVAALLNSAHPDVDFSLSTAEVITTVNAALASGSRSTILATAEDLADANEAGCPLS